VGIDVFEEEEEEEDVRNRMLVSLRGGGVN
jgi:hypothetical protein